MGNTQSAAVLFFDAALALFAFFVVAPMILNAISMFTVQKRFGETMIQEGVIDRETFDRMHTQKRNAGVLISFVVLAALAAACVKNGTLGMLCGGIPLLGGFLKYRRLLEYNNLTVQKFRNTYQSVMDEKKYNRFVDKNF